MRFVFRFLFFFTSLRSLESLMSVIEASETLEVNFRGGVISHTVNKTQIEAADLNFFLAMQIKANTHLQVMH